MDDLDTICRQALHGAYNPRRTDTLYTVRMRQLMAADAVLAEAQARLREIFRDEELPSYPCEAQRSGWTDDETGSEIATLVGFLRPDLSRDGVQRMSDAASCQARAEREGA